MEQVYNIKMNRGWFWYAPFIIFSIICFSCSMVSDGVAFTVNDEPISLAQYEQQLEKEKLMVIRDFEVKYKTRFGPGFWTMNFGGDIPANVLKKRAKDAIIVSTVKKMMARELGLVEKIGYDDFLKELDSVNKVRIKAVKDGKVIYGPVTYTVEMYSGYYMSLLENAILDKISTTELTADEIRSKYEGMIRERIKKVKIDIDKDEELVVL